jgi:hypothetical protein
MYGSRVRIPSNQESEALFQQCLTNAYERYRSGTLKPGEEVQVVNGQLQVSGLSHILEHEALLIKLIVQKNPNRQFYFQESYPLDSLYPCLSPHGPVLELHPEPLKELSPELVQKDEQYWNRLTSGLIGDWINARTSMKQICDFVDRVYLNRNLESFKGNTAFANNDAAQESFCKLRTSIAGVYAWRANQTQDVDEKRRMSNAADFAFKQAYTLHPSSPEVVFRYVQFLTTTLRRPDDAFLLGKTTLRLVPDEPNLKSLVRTLNELDR